MSLKFVVSVTVILMVASLASWAADDGAALYKAKCSSCHGANGEGKTAMKSPSAIAIKALFDLYLAPVSKLP